MAEEEQTASITITIAEDSVKYDTDLPLPDLVFWLEAVKSMVVNSTIQDKPE